MAAATNATAAICDCSCARVGGNYAMPCSSVSLCPGQAASQPASQPNFHQAIRQHTLAVFRRFAFAHGPLSALHLKRSNPNQQPPHSRSNSLPDMEMALASTPFEYLTLRVGGVEGVGPTLKWSGADWRATTTRITPYQNRHSGPKHAENVIYDRAIFKCLTEKIVEAALFTRINLISINIDKLSINKQTGTFPISIYKIN